MTDQIRAITLHGYTDPADRTRASDHDLLELTMAFPDLQSVFEELQFRRQRTDEIEDEVREETSDEISHLEGKIDDLEDTIHTLTYDVEEHLETIEDQRNVLESIKEVMGG